MTTKLTLLSAVAAVLAKPVADDDQAVTELTQFGAEVKTIRTFATDVAAEIGEADPAKAVAKLKALKSEHAAFQAEATTQKKARIATDVETTLKKHEKKLTVVSRKYFGEQLARELEAGVKLEEAGSTKALESLPELNITDRATGTDVTDPEKAKNPEAKQLARVTELLKGELKELNAKDPHAAWMRACEMIESEAVATA